MSGKPAARSTIAVAWLSLGLAGCQTTPLRPADPPGQVSAVPPDSGQEAGPQLLPFLKPHPEYSEWHALMGFQGYRTWQKTRDKTHLQKAVQDFTKAIEIERKAYYHESRGIMYEMLEDYENAISDYTACIELDPARTGCLLARAAALARRNDRGDLFLAAKDFEEWQRQGGGPKPTDVHRR